MRYSVVGLGKLGASMAAAIASRGHVVIGTDVNPRAVDLLSFGQAPVQESGLADLIVQHRDRLIATHDCAEAVLSSDVTFVVVPTPSDAEGAFSLEYAAAAFETIGLALAKKDDYHLVVLTSTVLPGSTRYGLIPILEAASGKVCGRDFGLCYSPEFIALGSVIRDFLNPDFLLIGEQDARAGKLLAHCYSGIVANAAPVRRMSLENAELTKIAINSYVTTKITFANTLAALCERLPGGNIDVVSDAMGLDKRIGRRYLTGGLGYGGPCFPRDNRALATFARAIDGAADIAELTDRLNRSVVSDAVAVIGPAAVGKRAAVLGLSYKPISHILEESQAFALAVALNDAGARVVAFDPLASDAARQSAAALAVVDSVADCLRDADVVVIATPDPVFATLTATDFAACNAGVQVFDFWRVLGSNAAASVRYTPVGHDLDTAANEQRLEAIWTRRPLTRVAA